jgi:hypothetical protein
MTIYCHNAYEKGSGKLSIFCGIKNPLDLSSQGIIRCQTYLARIAAKRFLRILVVPLALKTSSS